MNRTRLTIALLLVGLALAGFAMAMLAGDSIGQLLGGMGLLFAAVAFGLAYGFYAMRRMSKEGTTLAKEDGPVVASPEQNRARIKEVALAALAGAVLMPVVVVLGVDDPQMSLGVKIVGGVLVGLLVGPLFRLSLWWKGL